MDNQNTFHTPTSYTLVRIDYLVAMFAMIIASLVHWSELRLGAFLLAFAWIDVVGYIPGAIWFAYRTSPTRRQIPKIFYVLYNVCHSFLTQAIVVIAWRFWGGQWEWAMLAPAIHLCGDRGVFGNIYKPFGLPFEPIRHPAFERFWAEFRGVPVESAAAPERPSSIREGMTA